MRSGRVAGQSALVGLAGESVPSDHRNSGMIERIVGQTPAGLGIGIRGGAVSHISFTSSGVSP